MPQAPEVLAPDLSAAEVMTSHGASCAIYRDAPAWGTARTVAVGAFRCPDAASGAALLRDVCAMLAAEGFEAIIGPMEGDTWHAYRVVTETDGSRPFALEPVSGPADHAAFRDAGFREISNYVSSRAVLDDAIEATQPVVPGLRVEAWDGQNAEALIGQVYNMSLASFAGNAFYKPISRAAFLDLYRPIIPAMDPRFIFFARTDAGQIAGFFFAYPNLAEGARPTTLISKTYASAVRGAGRLLADAVHRSGREHGMTHVIHALMHQDNQSLHRSGLHGGHVFRRYALMGRKLL
jgi:hypothetical protein